MTTQMENQLLTRVGPGTPMGALMRQYWVPACLSSELKAGGDPLRLMLLGERLVGFRDSLGCVGMLDHRCPHRCASLFFGRNEEGGLRCVYHGWKYDVAGNCLDMPNLPADQDFRDKVKAKAYKVAERGGLVYVYMGEREVAPPLPALEAMMCPPEETNLWARQRECNWLQALEGDIDTSHFSFLHTGKVTLDDIDPDHLERFQFTDRAPRYHARPTDWGTMYAAYPRPTGPPRSWPSLPCSWQLKARALGLCHSHCFWFLQFRFNQIFHQVSRVFDRGGHRRTEAHQSFFRTERVRLATQDQNLLRNRFHRAG